MRRTLIDPVLRDSARRLRRDATAAEKVLWRAIRRSALGVTFRRQHPIGGVIADFACVEARVVFEIDGGQHGGECDEARDAALNASGWRVLRYWNNEVLENLNGVLADMARALKEARGASDEAPPP
ncbi:endonuclease domain-containing protein [Falsiroseomonas sp. HW251]|uniref:endonuclease domain-containing protein n=1 Tax=Falsiroseomonas sp. HW251 TaxID=3390998 RepID=UPI003D31B396